MKPSRRRFVILLSVCSVTAACSRSPTSDRPPQAPVPAAARQTPQLQPIAIPDFSNLAPDVRKQLEEGAATYKAAAARQDLTREQRAAAYGAFGELLMATGFRATAASCFANAEALAPHELRWPYYLGHIYRRDGRIVEAVAAFERAVRADATFMPAAVWLGNAYLDEGKTDEAEHQFSQALSLKPDTVAAVFGLGRAALARNDYATAAARFERVLALDPSASAVHHPLGLAYRALGRLQEAQTQLAYGDTSAEIRPPDPLDIDVGVETAVRYDLRGQRALEAGDWPEAIRMFQRAVALAPDDPALHHRYATALAVSGNRAAARAEFETLTHRWPRFEKGLFSLGMMKADAGDVRGALTLLRRAVAAAPTFLDARLQLAHLLRRSGNPAAALPEYAQVLAVDPRVREARFGHAMTLVSLTRYAEARAELEEGRRLHPDEAGFSLALARLLAAAPDDRVRDGAGALAVVDAIAQPQRRIEWAIVRAMALAEAGRFDDAARLQRAAITSLERNGSPELARTQMAVLQLYERHRPNRTPWQRDEPMELPDAGIVRQGQ